MEKQPFSFSNLAWNSWCLFSIIGIWPRFIEPKLISTNKIEVPIQQLPNSLHNFTILQLSDLHLGKHLNVAFLNKILSKIKALTPDMIVFTGDLLCFSKLDKEKEIQRFLCQLDAPYGSYMILGNHDYQDYVSVNKEGDYDVISRNPSSLKKGWKRLFTSVDLTGKIGEKARAVPFHPMLMDLIKCTPFKVLHNETQQIKIQNSFLNLCGLGEYTLGYCRPAEAFKNYDPKYSGVVLSHNPDSLPLLKSYPGNLILCGHTHGGQVNLPFLCKKFMLLENEKYKRGLHREGNRFIYINRGLGSVMPFRWFSRPEITLFKLVKI